MKAYERTFEEEVLERLARIEIHVEEVPAIKARVSVLEAHRNWLAGAMATMSAIAGYFIHLKA